MKSYLEVVFKIEDDIDKEVLNYHLSQRGVESIVEQESYVLAYFTRKKWNGVKQFFHSRPYSVQEVLNENWNAKWEASFEPVDIDQFCYVRAPFHPPSTNPKAIDLILEPRMAFGTAHHETTYMMMSQMKEISFKNKQVFDYGCGTAILSILAEKLGAASVFAIDIEENAIENAHYNIGINDCKRILCEERTLDEEIDETYDVILANINRGVLMSSAEDIKSYLKNGGILLMSGILLEDEELVRSHYENTGFQHLNTIEKGEWKCLKFTRA